MELNTYIDHTILKADAKKEDIKRICDEAKKYKFASVCVNPVHIKYVSSELVGSGVRTCAVVGFPLGANTWETKVFEARQCIENGADEIDMVINIGALKSGSYEEVSTELKAVRAACPGKILKVIIETCYLSDAEKEKACELALAVRADFVKTSTGFGSGGATLADVKLMKRIVDGKAGIKASGGIRDYETARQYIEHGATRLGTSSGIAIVEGGKG